MDEDAELRRLEEERFKLQERIGILRKKLEEPLSMSLENYRFGKSKLKTLVQKLDNLSARIHREESNGVKWNFEASRFSRVGFRLPEIANSNQGRAKERRGLGHAMRWDHTDGLSLPSISTYSSSGVALDKTSDGTTGVADQGSKEASATSWMKVGGSLTKRDSISESAQSKSGGPEELAIEEQNPHIIMVPNRRRVAARRANVYEKQLQFTSVHELLTGSKTNAMKANISKANNEAKSYCELHTASRSRSKWTEDVRRSFFSRIGALSPSHAQPGPRPRARQQGAWGVPTIFHSVLLGNIDLTRKNA